MVAAQARLPEGLRGIDDAPLQLVGLGDVAAVVGEIRVERPPGRRADLLAYSAALEALAASGAVVPVQFGSVLPDLDSVRDDVLAPGADHFGELLAQLAGRAQFNVRASYDEAAVLAEVVAADPAIADLRERTRDLPEEAAYADRVRLGELVAQAVGDTREHDAEVLLAAITPFTAAHRVSLGTGLDRVMDVAVLVDDDRREEFEQQLEDLAEVVHERIRLRLVGPVAPFDFVGDD